MDGVNRISYGFIVYFENAQSKWNYLQPRKLVEANKLYHS